jgi:V8-like Glu-specific endopeptidase
MEPWEEGGGEDSRGVVQQVGNVAESADVRERIADAMWADYRAVVERRNANRRVQAQRRRDRARQLRSQ